MNATLLRVKALRKMECAQVDPCSGAHLLVNVENGCAAAMMNRITGIRYVLRMCSVGNIHCIPATVRNGRNIIDRSRFNRIALHPTRVAAFKRIEVYRVGRIANGVSCDGCILPKHAVLITIFPVAAWRMAALQGIIINDHGPGLQVAFPWYKSIRSGIFQHGQQIGQYKRGRQQIFHHTEKPCPLP